MWVNAVPCVDLGSKNADFMPPLLFSFNPDCPLFKHIPLEARPREKLLSLGPAALANAELVALLLRTGFKGTPVLQFAQQLLDHFGGLGGLLRAGPNALKSIKGLGPAKRAEMGAVLELARRSMVVALTERTVFGSPDQLKNYLQMQLGSLEHEVFGVVFLDAQNCLLRFEEMFRGSITQAAVYPREVVKRALELKAVSVVLAHNHPSGCSQPSQSDQALTQSLSKALALVDVRVLDHMVVSHNGVVSMAEQGWM
jgi:DNA repair protein RadC